ncbi:dephospho-CoA kinase [Chloroflexota bacterium]
MKVIGLTGGIGSGKSTVARFLAKQGAVIIDADKVGHEALQPGSEAHQQAVAAFGEKIIAADGNIDRAGLGKIVFDNPEALAKLNRIMHPPMYNIVEAQLEEYRRQGVGVAVIDAPLLLEAGWDSLVDEIWVTAAPESTVLKRIKERTDLSEQEIMVRISSQLPAKERIRHASKVIDTDCSLDELKAKVEELWEELH